MENLKSLKILNLLFSTIRTLTYKSKLNKYKNFFEEFKDLCLEDLEKDSRNLFSKSSIDSINHLDQESIYLPQLHELMDPNRVERKEPLLIPINPLVQLISLHIWIFKELSTILMLLNLLIFKDIRNEDHSVYIKYFIETLTTYLIIDRNYYLIWFSIILKERAYKWYYNHVFNTFLNWDMIQYAFLEEFWLEIGQIITLITLSIFRQRNDEDIKLCI